MRICSEAFGRELSTKDKVSWPVHVYSIAPGGGGGSTLHCSTTVEPIENGPFDGSVVTVTS